MTMRYPLSDHDLSVDAFLADSVVAPGDGKLYVQGGSWNLLNTTTLPALHPRIGIAVIIKVPYELADNEPHKFEVRLEDADSRELTLGDAPRQAATADGKLRRVGGTFSVGRPPGIQVGDEQVVNVALNIDGLVFKRSGTYRFVISVDDNDLKFLQLRVNQMVQAGPILR